MAIDPCADQCLPQIDQTQMSEIYDLLNTKIRTDLQDDYDCKKINGATYADTWAKLMSTVITGTLNAMVALQTKETAADRCVKSKQCEVMDQDILNKKATESLTKRQERGFDDNARQKLYEAQMNAWSLMFSSGLLEAEPDHIKNQSAGDLYYSILDTIDDTTTTKIGNFTIQVAATIPDSSGNSTITWGTAMNATIYTLYVQSKDGSLPGYPKAVTANGTESVTFPIPGDNQYETYDIKVIATTDNTSSFSVTKTTVNVYGPVV